MKKTFLFMIVLIATPCFTHAVPLKLHVQNDAGEKLWYAYVYVNGRAVTVTDTLGFAQVPEGKLKVGDTVSVSYVGTETQQIVYDEALRKAGEYAFVLPEQYAVLTADEVVVKADIEKLYRKEVRQRRAYYYMSLWTASFDMQIKSPSGIVFPVKGTIEFPYSMGFRTRAPGKITTASDTTGLSWYIDSDLTYALTSLHTALYVAARPDAGNWKPSYGYRGKRDGNRIFRLGYAEIQPGISYQILLKADEESGEVKEIGVDIADLNDGSVTQAKAGIAVIPREILRMIPALLAPEWIDYSFQYKNGAQVKLKINNIQVKFHSWTDRKVKQYIKRMSE